VNNLSISGITMTALGFLGILLDAGNQAVATFNFLPEKVSSIIFALSGILSTMGIREIMLKSKEGIIKKVVDLKSETFYGSILAFATPLFIDPTALGVQSAVLGYILQGAGVLFGVLGLGNAGKRGVFSGQ